VQGGWAWFDWNGREIERRVETDHHVFISGILGPIEPQGVSVSTPFDPAEYPRKRKAKR
jgi:hypothetical protein